MHLMTRSALSSRRMTAAVGAGVGVGVGVLLIAGVIALRFICPWIFTDIKYIRKVKIMLGIAEKRLKEKTLTIDIFEQQVDRIPEKDFIIFEEQRFTYRYVNEQANRLGRSMFRAGLKTGDIVAMMVCNEPAFLWTFLGLQKIGIQTAVININLRGHGLLHCLQNLAPKAVIVGEGKDLLSSLHDILGDLPDVQVFTLGSVPEKQIGDGQSLAALMAEAPSDNIDRAVRASIQLSDPAVFVFTSGSTGLPKAAIIAHRRILVPLGLFHCYGLADDSVVYVPLPLYHTSGLLLGVGNVISSGFTMVLARKFSASRFWEDCRRHNVTAFLYIGEMCRYLLARPETTSDTDHSIQVAIGNGLRRDIFRAFKDRFGIPNVLELYTATECNVGFINLLNIEGACGRSSPLLQKFVQCDFLRFDAETDMPVRGQDGFCIKAQQGEPGLLVTKITPRQPYDGYKATEKVNEQKYLRDVFTMGDLYFNTGDLFVRDSNYHMFFNDRIGDTFRWKGENVSTTEVSNVICELDFVIDAIVYGVEIQGTDGRAGMACLCLHDEAEQLTEKQLHQLTDHCNGSLPVYARPVFLRISKELDMTSTFKQTKMALKREAWDKTRISDRLYFFDKAAAQFKELDLDAYKEIATGNPLNI